VNDGKFQIQPIRNGSSAKNEKFNEIKKRKEV
jgi:hypothetical protein